MDNERERSTTDVDTKTHARRLAEEEGRPRPHVMDAYQRSHAMYAELYKRLAQ